MKQHCAIYEKKNKQTNKYTSEDVLTSDNLLQGQLYTSYIKLHILKLEVELIVLMSRKNIVCYLYINNFRNNLFLQDTS